MDTRSARGKYGNAIVERYRALLQAFAVEISCMLIRNGSLTYLTLAIRLSPRRNCLVHSLQHTQQQSEA